MQLKKKIEKKSHIPGVCDVEIIIVGGGHAGCEAALVSARLGCRTLLITSRIEAIGNMPCNPSVGGLAKSHLVYELDALGGEMGLNADLTAIQLRTLNKSRGPAVRATRAQCDKKRYSLRLQQVVQGQDNLTVIEDEAIGLLLENSQVLGIKTAQHGTIRAKKVVLTTGTALGGRIYVGKEITQGAGDGLPATDSLARELRELGFPMFRLKTGTPPRLTPDSIDWKMTVEQPGDTPPPLFSARMRLFHVEQSHLNGDKIAECSGMHKNRETQYQSLRHLLGIPLSNCSTWNNLGLSPGSWSLEQISCWLTHTNQATHGIIRDNLSESALYGGLISGTGVRYCPSVEDKIVKFSQAEQHHVFLEPEGSSSNALVYPNGISNSLPAEVQVRLVHSIKGLEQAEIVQFGYAIEYEAIDARTLHHTLESKLIGGLYFAGQVNGTTGYEEAAAQGFMAGANAVLSVRGSEPFVLSRQEAYIGVMIDDLVTLGTDEPYRMFTSRAERRLLLRQDNAGVRLLPYAEHLGVAQQELLDEVKRKQHAVESEIARLHSTRHEGMSLAVLLSRPGVGYTDLPVTTENLASEVVEQVCIQVKYAGYIAQEARAATRARAEEQVVIPAWLDYGRIPALRNESREKLQLVKPANLGQAARIPGVSPADISVLSIVIRQGQHRV